VAVLNEGNSTEIAIRESQDNIISVLQDSIKDIVVSAVQETVKDTIESQLKEQTEYTASKIYEIEEKLKKSIEISSKTCETISEHVAEQDRILDKYRQKLKESSK
jgi:hypothetical protein